MGRALRGMVALCFALPAAASSYAGEPPGGFFETHRLAREALERQAEGTAGVKTGDKEEGAAEAARLYELFAAANSESPEASLCRVLRGIVLWRDLKNMAAAEKDFDTAAAAAGEDRISAQAALLGKRWLTRVRMTRIARACRTYYIDAVEYPWSLEKLVASRLLDGADLVDAWGEAFAYEATEHELVRGVARQQFTLRSTHVEGGPGKTEKLLHEEKDFAKSFSLMVTRLDEPRSVMVAIKGKPGLPVPATQTGNSPIIELGNRVDGLTAVLIESRRAILCSSDYIVVVSK